MTDALQQAQLQLGAIILGKQHEIRLCLACLLARGHLLIEDTPGLGFKRVQFTSDLLPADVLGVSVFDRDSGKFRFQAGPIFSEVLLADEINRAPPKAQSALLEAMEEHQVTIDGTTYPLPDPFFVIATLNPIEHAGTFVLPDSQLDRFLLCIQLGYPTADMERQLLQAEDRRDLLRGLAPQLDGVTLLALQKQVTQVHVAAPLLDYLQALLAFTRTSIGVPRGLSPRAGLGLLRVARAWALLAGRDLVLPEDVQAVLGAVIRHRLRDAPVGDPASRLLEAVPIP
jgi:MoxR-like ATPase